MCPDWQQREISIHSLHTEGDNCAINRPYRTWKFQSTPSTRRETIRGNTYYALDNISIHSLHTEGDNNRSFKNLIIINFNPLPPHGGRLVESPRSEQNLSFQSTPSTRRETLIPWRFFPGNYHFNPLPPHGGRPAETGGEIATAINFNPLPPHGGRRTNKLPYSLRESISIHSLHTEGDKIYYYHTLLQKSFQSTPSTRRET